jgi:hypothetical protein
MKFLFSVLVLGLGFVGQAQATHTNVSYRCSDDVVDVNFNAQIRATEVCGRGISGGPSWFYECIPTGDRATGSATLAVLGNVTETYRFIGLSPNPNLIDHVGYVFEKTVRRGPRTTFVESLVMYVRLGNPERSYFTVSNERGLQERRRVSCEITH